MFDGPNKFVNCHFLSSSSSDGISLLVSSLAREEWSSPFPSSSVSSGLGSFFVFLRKARLFVPLPPSEVSPLRFPPVEPVEVVGPGVGPDPADPAEAVEVADPLPFTFIFLGVFVVLGSCRAGMSQAELSPVSVLSSLALFTMDFALVKLPVEVWGTEAAGGAAWGCMIVLIQGNRSDVGRWRNRLVFTRLSGIVGRKG